jgi:hypothetical protein
LPRAGKHALRLAEVGVLRGGQPRRLAVVPVRWGGVVAGLWRG